MVLKFGNDPVKQLLDLIGIFKILCIKYYINTIFVPAGMVLKFRNDPVKQLLDLIGILGEKKIDKNTISDGCCNVDMY